MPMIRKPARAKPGRPAHASQAPAEGVILFVRDFPAPLAREARALAAMRGVNIREVLVEALRAYLDQAPDWRR